MPNWYYAADGAAAGPVDEDELRAMAGRGELTPTTWVLPEGETEWVLLRDAGVRLGTVAAGAGGPETSAPVTDGILAPGTSTPTTPGRDPATEDARWPVPAAEPWEQPPGPTRPSADQPWPDQPWPDQPWGGAPASGPQGSPPGWGAPPPGWEPTPAPGWGPTPTPGWGPTPTPWGGPGYDVAPSPQMASWGRRFAAKVIDTLILLIPSAVVTLAIAGRDIFDQLGDNDAGSFQLTITGPIFAAQLVAGLIGLAYYAVLNGRGQTLGKMALGIRVVGLADGGPIGPGKGLVRHGIQFLEAIPGVSLLVYAFLLADSLWPLADARKQAVHDKMAGSVVIRTR